MFLDSVAMTSKWPSTATTASANEPLYSNFRYIYHLPKSCADKYHHISLQNALINHLGYQISKASYSEIPTLNELSPRLVPLH